MPRMILDPEGMGVILADIQVVHKVRELQGYNYRVVGYMFDVTFSNGRQHQFSYYFNAYSEEPETLKLKVENVRQELMRMLNDGNDVKQVLGTIKLAKKDGAKQP